MKTWLIFNPEEEWAGERVEARTAKSALRGYGMRADHGDYCHACQGNEDFVCPGPIEVTLYAAADKDSAFNGGESATKTYHLFPHEEGIKQ